MTTCMLGSRNGMYAKKAYDQFNFRKNFWTHKYTASKCLVSKFKIKLSTTSKHIW